MRLNYAEPVVSKNTIASECAEFQSVEDPALGQISDRAPAFSHRQTSPVNVMMENKNIKPEFGSNAEGELNCRERLGGLLRYYYRDAACIRRF